MKELYIRTIAQKAALIDAIEHHLEVLEVELEGECLELAEVEGWDFEVKVSNINTSRQEIAFLNAFLPALKSHPAGAGGVFLEAVEVGVVKAALASLADIENETTAQEAILAVVSAENIKNTIRTTAREWGAIDPERLAIALSNQVRETLEGNNAAKDLYDQLN